MSSKLTCCRERDQAAKCQWMEFWSFWFHHNPLDPSASSHLAIAGKNAQGHRGHLAAVQWWKPFVDLYFVKGIRFKSKYWQKTISQSLYLYWGVLFQKAFKCINIIGQFSKIINKTELTTSSYQYWNLKPSVVMF